MPLGPRKSVFLKAFGTEAPVGRTVGEGSNKILMTTLTTILGLLPLSLGLGAGGEIQASLARVVIGGLTASTLVTLIFIPVVYVSKENALAWIRRRIRPGAGQARAAEA